MKNNTSTEGLCANNSRNTHDFNEFEHMARLQIRIINGGVTTKYKQAKQSYPLMNKIKAE